MEIFKKKVTQLFLILILAISSQLVFGQNQTNKATKNSKDIKKEKDEKKVEEDEEQESLSLPVLSEQRINVVMLPPVIRPNRYWVQTGLAGSIYDARRDILGGRLSPGVQAGKRFEKYGFFGTLELDRTYDFTLDTKTLDVLNIGIGGEYLTFLGHVRSTIAVGLSVLLSDTDIDEKGETGWFIDLKPASLRWDIGTSSAIEFTPLSLDIIAPVTKGIPLLIISYMSVISYEWSL